MNMIISYDMELKSLDVRIIIVTILTQMLSKRNICTKSLYSIA